MLCLLPVRCLWFLCRSLTAPLIIPWRPRWRKRTRVVVGILGGPWYSRRLTVIASVTIKGVVFGFRWVLGIDHSHQVLVDHVTAMGVITGIVLLRRFEWQFPVAPRDFALSQQAIAVDFHEPCEAD